MEPFTIQCSTCQSNIRVRNPKMVGQLANCPKCNSMLMISPPQQVRVEDPRGTGVDSMALTQEGISSDLLPPEAPIPETPITDADAASAATDEYRLAPEPPPASSANAPADFAKSWQPDEQPLLPSDQWTSQSSAKTRQFLLIGFLGLTGIILASLLFVVFLRWHSSVDSEGPPVAALDPNAAIGDSDANPASDPAMGDLPLDGRNGADTSDDGSAAAGIAEITPGTNPEPTADPIESTTLPPDQPTVVEFPATGTPDTRPEGSEDAAAPNPAEPSGPELPGGISDFAPVLNWQLQPTLPEQPLLPSAAPLTAEDLGLPAGDAIEAVPAIDWASRSQVVMPALIFGDGVSLSQLVNLWTHLSGVPTVVNLDALAVANVDSSQRPELGTLRDMKVIDIANRLASTLGLTATFKGDRYLELAASEELLKSKLPATAKFQDLLTNGESADAFGAWLIESIETLFPQTQGSWTISDGQLQPTGAQVDLSTWLQVLRMLETWRAAAGLPSGVEGYENGQLVMPFVEQSSLKFLDHVLREVTPQARPIGQLLSRICKESNAQCWVDWGAVGYVGIGPATRELLVTHGRTLKQTLADFLEQHTLVLAIVDENTLWLTSPKAYREAANVFVVPSQGRTPEQWVQQYARDLTPVDDAGVGSILVRATPDNRFFIVRCCRPKLNLVYGR